ncbi:MAG TPA: hypothetical protein VMI94_18430 [Bryobacteraceae bacterium]|nr:hypothetical protein [Bryobacteraceae bacterium]
MNSAGSPLRLVGAEADVAGRVFHSITLKFDGPEQPLAYLTLTVNLRTVSGQTATLVYSEDRTIRPSPLSQTTPIVLRAEALAPSDISRADIRLDYAQLIGSSPFGLHADRVHAKILARKKDFLAKIQKLRFDLAKVSSESDAKALIPAQPDFMGFNNALAHGGISAVLAEIDRVERILMAL